jgi:Raf kinase inhibitor-like YbhB/YbcL family protein
VADSTVTRHAGAVLTRLSLALVLLLGATSCGGTSEETSKIDAPDVITVTSSDFGDGEQIPKRLTCDGDGTSPQLGWRGVPKSAKALVLVVDDPDAPDGTFVHWLVLDITPGTTKVDADSVPTGAVQAENGAGEASYTGPCPPSGTHHYRFTVYALEAKTRLHAGESTGTALRAVRKVAMARGRLVGTYSRG